MTTMQSAQSAPRMGPDQVAAALASGNSAAARSGTDRTPADANDPRTIRAFRG